MSLPIMECQSTNEDSVTLIWHGRAQEYRVEYKRSNETWLECQRTHTGPGSPSILVISGLRKGSKYVFRLFAAFERGVFEGPGVELTFKTKKGGLFGSRR